MLEEGSDFIRKPLQRLPIVWSRKVEVHAVEAEAQVGRQLLNDHVRRSDQSWRTLPSAVGSLDVGYDLPGSGLRPTDDGRAGHKRPLDLVAGAPDPLAPAAQDAVLVAHRLNIAAHIPFIGVASHRGQCPPLPPRRPPGSASGAAGEADRYELHG